MFPEPRAAIPDALDATYRGTRSSGPEGTADLHFSRLRLERTTGFEPATPTLAKLAAHEREQP